MEPPKVFISYAREDVEHARRVHEALKNAGANPWLDEVDLLPGQDWRNAITTAISESRYFIALISSKSVGKRGFVQKEFKQALDVLDEFPESDVFLIPARVDDAEPSYAKLKKLHRVDLFPDWNSGIAKILLTMELREGSAGESIGGRTFSVSAEWLDDGLQLRADKLRIPPDETSALFKSWLGWLPKFVEQETPSSKNASDALEKAFILATLRAIHDVYEVVPDEEEMQRGTSILSRKIDLFFSFAKEAYVKAKAKGIQLEDYLFADRSKSFETDGEVGPDDHRALLRTMLHNYVMRICDVKLDEVERFETVMRKMPPWEPLVEQVYEVDENSVRKAFTALKEQMPDKDEEELTENIASFYVSRCLVEEFPFAEEE